MYSAKLIQLFQKERNTTKINVEVVVRIHNKRNIYFHKNSKTKLNIFRSSTTLYYVFSVNLFQRITHSHRIQDSVGRGGASLCKVGGVVSILCFKNKLRNYNGNGVSPRPSLCSLLAWVRQLVWPL